MADLNLNFESKARLTAYQEQLVSQRTTTIELKSIFGISDIRDNVTETGGGTVTNDGRNYLLNVSGTGQEAILASQKRGNYLSGKGGEYGIGLHTSTNTITGDASIEWGAIGDTEEIKFGFDSGGIFVAVVDEGVQTMKKYQADWNGDKLNGTGDSGLELLLDDGEVYQIDFTWYGYGVILFRVEYKTDTGVKNIVAHYHKVDGRTSIKTPNLPISAVVKQGTGTDNITAYIGGRQFSVIGTYNPSFRESSDYRFGVTVPTLSTNPTPLIAFKQKTSLQVVQAEFDSLEVITDNDIVYEVYVAEPSSLTGEVFGNLERILPAETAFEVDKSSTAFDSSSGNLITRGLIKGGEKNTSVQQSIRDLAFDIPPAKILVVTAFAKDASATVDVIAKLNEEW